MTGRHIPVLLSEVLELLEPRPGDTVLDGTVGGGGHAEAMLRRIAPGGRLVGLDRDGQTRQRAAERLGPLGPAVTLRHGNFADAAAVLDELGLTAKIDVALLDLGVSSFQLDQGQRGFSFQSDGPLDMRMDPTDETTAADLVNELDEQSLADLFYQLGQERNSRRIARRIVEERQRTPIETTAHLARLVLSARPARQRQKWQRLHPATRVFQALRIRVNRELESLETFCQSLPEWLAPGGRVGVISFHSLEDRVVKTAFREYRRDGVMEILTRKPVTPTEDEQRENPRSRSAKLRVARRSDQTAGGRGIGGS